MLELTDTPKAETDLMCIMHEVSTSPFIAQLARNEIARYMHNNTIQFLYDSAEILGFAAWQNINADWSEIGPVYLLTKARGKGLATQYTRTLLEMNTGKKLFAVTKNPRVKAMLTKAGFRKITLFGLPAAVFIHLLRQMTFSRIIALFQKRSTNPIEFYVAERISEAVTYSRC